MLPYKKTTPVLFDNPLMEIKRDLNDSKRREEIARTMESPASGLGGLVAWLGGLPGLRGLWSSSIVGTGGGLQDRGGLAQTLTYNGNPLFNYSDFVPYCAYDGVGDYHSRATETALEILGTEAVFNSAVRGLTCGLIFYSTVAGSNQGLLSKWTTTGNQRSYRIIKTSGNLADFSVSSNGTAETTVTSAAQISLNAYHVAVGRFTPSTELALWLDGVKAVNTTSIPASVFNSTTAFELARYNGATLLTGRIVAGWLAANTWSDSICMSVWNRCQNFLGL